MKDKLFKSLNLKWKEVKMMKRLLIICALSAMLIAISLSGQAQAYQIQFNDTKLGWITVSALDWAPGNALADEAIPLAIDPATTDFSLYYHAKLAGFRDANNNLITGTGLGIDYEITIVAGGLEMGSRMIGSNGQTASFQLKGTNNFLEVYYDTAKDASDLNGTGFRNGDPLFNGTAFQGFGTFFVPINKTTGLPIISNLDQFGPNNYPGVGTVKGDGGSSLLVNVDKSSINGTYIKLPTPVMMLDLEFNTNNKTPFNEADPSEVFWDGTAYITPERGDDITGGTYPNGINGVPRASGELVDFQFQADGNSAFVPEPATLILAGLGLLGLSGAAVLRRKN